MRCTILVSLAAIAIAASAARADETAVLVLDAPGAGDHVALFNRALPAGTAIKVQVQAANADPLKGTLELWPDVAGTCGGAPGPTQHQQIALSVSGSADTRVLEGTLSPLQIATSYCFRITYERAISSERLTAVVDAVATTPIDWQHVCELDPMRRTERVRDDLTARIRATLASLAAAASPPAPAVSDDARIRDAGAALAGLLELDARCRRVHDAIARADDLAAAASKAGAPQVLAASELHALATTAKAWPVVVTRSGTSFIVWRLADILGEQAATVSSVVADVSLVDADLALDIQKMLNAKDDDARAQRTAILTRLRTPPPKALPLALYSPSSAKAILASDLADHPAALITDLVTQRDAILRQLDLIGRQDKPVADAWRAALTKLARAADELVAANTAATTAAGDRDAALKSVQTDLERLTQGETVKNLLRQTETARVEARSDRPLATDENASLISANTGVMVASPFIHNGDGRGFDTPWLVPYAGATVYFRRVDRVIDLDQLVGHTYWQRHSFSAGVLLTTPTVNGKGVAGPWNAAVVPYVGFGWRTTQYLRVDVGLIPFKYADRNPVITATSWGAAVWLGVSIDADVWAAVSGKIGK